MKLCKIQADVAFQDELKCPEITFMCPGLIFFGPRITFMALLLMFFEFVIGLLELRFFLDLKIT